MLKVKFPAPSLKRAQGLTEIKFPALSQKTRQGQGTLEQRTFLDAQGRSATS